MTKERTMAKKAKRRERSRRRTARATRPKVNPDGTMPNQRESNVTRLDDAKALRAMSLPLSTPVVDGELSPTAEKKVEDVFKAMRAFGVAVRPWAQNQTAKRYAAVRRTRKEFMRALARAEPKNEEPESVAVAALTEPCRLIWEKWDDICAALESGERVRIQGEGAPWPFGPFPRNIDAD
jgi:hypothetical protein